MIFRDSGKSKKIEAGATEQKSTLGGIKTKWGRIMVMVDMKEGVKKRARRRKWLTLASEGVVFAALIWAWMAIVFYPWF